MGQQKGKRKLTGPNPLPAVHRTKGLSKSRGASRLRPAQPPGGRRQGVGERGKLSPGGGTPYRAASRPPVSNQRPPEIPDGRHPPGGSQRDPGRTHLTRACGDWGWGRGGRKARAPGESEPPSSWLMSRSGGEGTKRRRSRVPAFVEHPRAGTPRSAGPAPYRAAGSLSSVEGKTAPLPPRSAMEPAT